MTLHWLFSCNETTHRVDGQGARTDESNAVLFKRLAEGCVFGEETISWMDGLGAGGLACLDDMLNLEIGFCTGSRANSDGLVCKCNGKGMLGDQASSSSSSSLPSSLKMFTDNITDVFALTL